MKKTATLTVYNPYCARPTACIVDVTYRGKIIRSFEGAPEDVLIGKAAVFAKNMGYDRTKTLYVVGA